MITIEQPTIPADLSISSFEDAVKKLEVSPIEVILICPESLREVATVIRQKYRNDIFVLPTELFCNPYSWVVFDLGFKAVVTIMVA